MNMLARASASCMMAWNASPRRWFEKRPNFENLSQPRVEVVIPGKLGKNGTHDIESITFDDTRNVGFTPLKSVKKSLRFILAKRRISHQKTIPD
jgi:hypothetical protein